MGQACPSSWRRLRRMLPALSTKTPASCLMLVLPLLLLLALAPGIAAASTADTDTPGILSLSRDDEGAVIGGLADAEPAMYEAEFDSFDRSITGRAPAGVTGLASNTPMTLNVPAGETQYFVYEKAKNFARRAYGEDEYEEDEYEDYELRRRSPADDDDDDSTATSQNSTTRTVYLSANTCIIPQSVANSTTTAVAPQLTMYISSSTENTSPGPNGNAKQQTAFPFTEGAVMVSLNATTDIYIGISAPNISASQLSGTYNMEVAASIDGWYHSYDNETDANLIWVDSDSNAALLITHNLTESNSSYEAEEQVMSREPYVMFAQNVNVSSINGVRLSYCGLQNYAQIAATNNGKFTSMVNTSMTRRGLGNLPKQQFYFSGLNSSSSYLGILASLPDNGTSAIGAVVVGGGGKVTRATSFSTKSANGNCEVVFNLTFCNETAYAVPSNPVKFTNVADLAQVYDKYASDMYDTFTKVMAQIPCEAPSTQRYSLARNCTDCRAAYKNWLCSVAIPRCSDFTDTYDWLQPRALSQVFPTTGKMLDAETLAAYRNISAFNSSRNPFIDEAITPGPYKEVLPCDDLCYNLVQSCPADLGFSCPLPGQIGFNTSYGLRTLADQNGEVTCNYPGSAHFISKGPARAPLSWTVVVLAVVATILAVAV